MTARSTSYDQVPWGRRPHPDIPVPPFAHAAAAARFLELLATWLGVLGGTDVRAYALATLLQDERAARRHSPSTELSPLALRVAVATFFPVDRLRADAAHVREAWARRQAAPYLLGWGD